MVAQDSFNQKKSQALICTQSRFSNQISQLQLSSAPHGVASLTCLILHAADKSRKGSVDAPIVELVDELNNHEHIFTSSSCSGEICDNATCLTYTMQGAAAACWWHHFNDHMLMIE